MSSLSGLADVTDLASIGGHIRSLKRMPGGHSVEVDCLIDSVKVCAFGAASLTPTSAVRHGWLGRLLLKPRQKLAELHT